jgi:hypothetical protein
VIDGAAYMLASFPVVVTVDIAGYKIAAKCSAVILNLIYSTSLKKMVVDTCMFM